MYVNRCDSLDDFENSFSCVNPPTVFEADVATCILNVCMIALRSITHTLLVKGD